MSSNPSNTLLSALEPFQAYNALPKDTIHPFATSAPEACELLHNLINVTGQISQSLGVYDAAPPFSNPKLISFLRQHTSIENSLYSSRRGINQLISSLRERKEISYGENIPPPSTPVHTWCIEQLASWGTSVGMETYPNEDEQGVTMVLAAKVLVIDVEFAIDKKDTLNPRLRVSNVKTSNALLAGASNESTSPFLDAFLMDGLTRYCDEMQKPEAVRDPQRAASIRRGLVENLRYLVILDHLASRKDDGGIRWFTDLDALYTVLEPLTIREAEASAMSLSLSQVPLDILVTRGHALAIPHLNTPSMSFLTYLSPLAYMSLLQSIPKGDSKAVQSQLPVDIPISHLRTNLRSLQKGVTVANLTLAKMSEEHLWPSTMSMANLPTRPTFPLLLAPPEPDDHAFPQLDDNFAAAGIDRPQTEQYTWVLDFTQGGSQRGVVVSQSRMKEIELAVNPLGTIESVSDMLSFTSPGSWLELLLRPGSISPPEFYTSIYTSPKSFHPPLKLRLAAPQEPGFLLERVPVRTIKEVWAVLEVVREQCWLNEILLSCDWVPEGTKWTSDTGANDTGAAEEELQAILAGTYQPREIPVNITLPAGATTDALFGPDVLDFGAATRPKIVMFVPEKPPFPGSAEITVMHDEHNPRGVSVAVRGAMGSDLQTHQLEEICRRGGTLGLAGRIWASCAGSS